MAKNVIVLKESESGRNLLFLDKKSKEKMTLNQFVKKIVNGSGYSNDYYVREINGIKTPVSKPDGKENNNLG